MTVPSPASFRASLRSRIQVRARQTRRPVAALRREFFMQRFLARVFADPTAPWVVTGGGGLLVRLPGARSSQDLDLIRPDTDIADAIDELRRFGGACPDIDPSSSGSSWPNNSPVTRPMVLNCSCRSTSARPCSRTSTPTLRWTK